MTPGLSPWGVAGLLLAVGIGVGALAERARLRERDRLARLLATLAIAAATVGAYGIGDLGRTPRAAEWYEPGLGPIAGTIAIVSAVLAASIAVAGRTWITGVRPWSAPVGVAGALAALAPLTLAFAGDHLEGVGRFITGAVVLLAVTVFSAGLAGRSATLTTAGAVIGGAGAAGQYGALAWTLGGPTAACAIGAAVTIVIATIAAGAAGVRAGLIIAVIGTVNVLYGIHDAEQYRERGARTVRLAIERPAAPAANNGALPLVYRSRVVPAPEHALAPGDAVEVVLVRSRPRGVWRAARVVGRDDGRAVRIDARVDAVLGDGRVAVSFPAVAIASVAPGTPPPTGELVAVLFVRGDGAAILSGLELPARRGRQWPGVPGPFDRVYRFTTYP